MSRSTLNRKLLWNLADPSLLYGILSIGKYLIEGESITPPLINLKVLRWLPNLKVALAPYGLEYYLENYFIQNKKAFYIYAKMGQHGGKHYGGVGFEDKELFSFKYGTLGTRFDLWTQPNFLFQINLRDLERNRINIVPLSKDANNIYGMAGSLIGRIHFKNSPISLYLEGGYKTKGYLPGNSLNDSLIARLGLSAHY